MFSTFNWKRIVYLQQFVKKISMHVKLSLADIVNVLFQRKFNIILLFHFKLRDFNYNSR